MTPVKKSRQLRTPAERAVAALGVAQRAVVKLERKRDTLNAELIDVANELEVAQRRRDYLAQNPDLPEADTDPIPGVDGGES